METEVGGRLLGQRIALAVGLAYLLIGIGGFAATGFDNFAARSLDNELFGLFNLNPLHNLVHIALGILWIGGAESESGARTTNIILGAVLGLVAVLGFTGMLVDEWLNIHKAADADNFLHAGTALLTIYFGLTSEAGAPTPPPTPESESK